MEYCLSVFSQGVSRLFQSVRWPVFTEGVYRVQSPKPQNHPIRKDVGVQSHENLVSPQVSSLDAAARHQHASLHQVPCIPSGLRSWCSCLGWALSNCRSACPSVCLPECLPACVCLSVCLSIYLSICLSVHLSSHLSIYPSIRLSVYPSIYLSIRRSICLSICLTGSAKQLPNQPLHRHSQLNLQPFSGFRVWGGPRGPWPEPIYSIQYLRIYYIINIYIHNQYIYIYICVYIYI